MSVPNQLTAPGDGIALAARDLILVPEVTECAVVMNTAAKQQGCMV
jgi:hypothetical protein